MNNIFKTVAGSIILSGFLANGVLASAHGELQDSMDELQRAERTLRSIVHLNQISDAAALAISGDPQKAEWLVELRNAVNIIVILGEEENPIRKVTLENFIQPLEKAERMVKSKQIFEELKKTHEDGKTRAEE